MSDNIKVENNADIGSQTIVNIQNMSGNIAAPGQVVYTISLNGKNSDDVDTKHIALNSEYYSLLVVNFEEFQAGRVIVRQNWIWPHIEEPEINELFFKFDDESISRLKKLPCIFSNENYHYHGKARPEQMAHLGVITDIRAQQDEIIIYYNLLMDIAQQQINDLAPFLGLRGRTGITEMNQTHWTVKRVNLIQELMAAGIDVIEIINQKTEVTIND